MIPHTEGRISYRANGDANSYALLDERGHWWLSVLMNGEQLTSQQDANLRRLAACWNSFVGVPTAGIEAMGGVALYKGEPVGELAKLREQLAAARALLAKARPHINPHAVDSSSLDTDIADIRISTMVRRFLEGGAA